MNVSSRLRPLATTGSSTTGESSPPSPSTRSDGPIVGPNAVASTSWSARASSSTVWMPSAPRRRAIRGPMPQIAVTGRAPIVGIHSRRVSRATPPGLANPVAVFACSLDSPIPTAHDSPVSTSSRALSSSGERLRIVGRDADERLVPPELLDGHVHRPQRRHHPRPTPPRRPACPTAGTRRPGSAGRRSRAACRSARRTPAPRTTPSPPPAAAGAGCRRRRPRPAARRARGGAAPRRRRGTGRGRRGGSSPALLPGWRA